MVPYGRHDIGQSDIDAVVDVLKSDFLTQGPVVENFSHAVAQYCDVKHAVAVNSATSALHIACLALDLGPGDILWTSPNTFVASANCALYCGAKVDFVDIDPKTYNMDPEILRQKLERAAKEGRLPKVVVPVHFAGQPCDMQGIFRLSQEFGFKIIEDASHAIGASYSCLKETELFHGHAEGTDKVAMKENASIKVGACRHSDITVFSFHPVKIITTGEGGLATTNDTAIAEKMKRLSTHGITRDLELMSARPENEIWTYQQIELGFNYRMTDIQAALGFSQMKRLDQFVQRRHELAKRYDRELSELPVVTPYQSETTYSSYHLYPVCMSKAECPLSQQEVFGALLRNNIGANLHYIPVHRQPFFERLGFCANDFPEAERFHREVISLPMFAALTDDDQSHVIKTMKSLFP